MGEDDPRSSFKDMDARLKAARKRRISHPRQRMETRPLGIAMRLSVELAAGLVVGGVMGYFLDRWLHTRPWLMIVFFFLGAAAGIRNVLRAAEEINRAAEEGTEDESSTEE